MNLDRLVRKCISNLSPYSTARDEYKGEIGVYLDANESPFDNGYNRYPDPYQIELKKVIGEIKNIEIENIFLGNGSDEAIVLMYNIFCEPRIDEVVIIKPSYGMYTVAARTNDVEYNEVALNADFQLDTELILSTVTDKTKVIFLCSPNNPSGNLLRREDIYSILNGFEGIVVVDEAYIDFCAESTMLHELHDFPNLVILQTMSKAWGLAGLRLGMAFASKEIIDLMTKVKYPYNINCATQQIAIEELTTKRAEKLREVEMILSERTRVIEALSKIEFIEHIYPTDANFVLIKTANATALYNELIGEKIIVRDRSGVFACGDTLRITIGKKEENDKLINYLINRGEN